MQVVVFTQRRDMTDALVALLGQNLNLIVMDSRPANNNYTEKLAAFRGAAGAAVLIMSSRLALSVDLSVARHAVFPERWWNPFVEQQNISRLRRPGQTKRVCVWYVHIKYTFDDAICGVHAEKLKSASKALLAAGRENGREFDYTVAALKNDPSESLETESQAVWDTIKKNWHRYEDILQTQEGALRTLYEQVNRVVTSSAGPVFPRRITTIDPSTLADTSSARQSSPSLKPWRLGSSEEVSLNTLTAGDLTDTATSDSQLQVRIQKLVAATQGFVTNAEAIAKAPDASPNASRDALAAHMASYLTSGNPLLNSTTGLSYRMYHNTITLNRRITNGEWMEMVTATLALVAALNRYNSAATLSTTYDMASPSDCVRVGVEALELARATMAHDLRTLYDCMVGQNALVGLPHPGGRDMKSIREVGDMYHHRFLELTLMILANVFNQPTPLDSYAAYYYAIGNPDVVSEGTYFNQVTSAKTKQFYYKKVKNPSDPTQFLSGVRKPCDKCFLPFWGFHPNIPVFEFLTLRRLVHKALSS